MLLFPKLLTRDGRCVYPESANLGRMYENPAEMARMLRVMNARSILVVDEEAKGDFSTAATMAGEVDIPIQLDAGIASPELVSPALAAGIYRCVVSITSPDDVDLAGSLVQEFGAQRLTVRLPGDICLGDDAQLVSLLDQLAQSRCSRIIVTLGDRTSWRDSDNLKRKLATIVGDGRQRRFRITIDGGVTNAEDLLALNKFAPSSVDSVALYEPLFAARFPCQAFWCWSSRDDVDLTSFSTATLKDCDS